MSKPAIKVEGLCKEYVIGPAQSAGQTFREALTDSVMAPVKRLLGRGAVPAAEERFWALQDVSFAVAPGEVLGIIGRNGAGKSTLLKVLSRITAPTKGRIEINGRIASLLEVGTGFHPELTGRENIRLNGAILGMSGAEIRSKFDAIVDFAGVEKFLDTPVKRYSSGMYVRLAFAVAAHLEPEILIIDEVLAVGDAEFQRKCLGKMGEVAKGGRTVLFVSHNMAAVQNLCSEVIWLDGGRLKQAGGTDTIIAAYHRAGSGEIVSDLLEAPRPSWAKRHIARAWTENARGVRTARFGLGEPITVVMAFEMPEGREVRRPVMGVVINHALKGVVGGVNTRMTGFSASEAREGDWRFECRLAALPLLPGTYTIDLWFGDGDGDVDNVNSAVELQIEPTDVYGTGKTPFGHMGILYFDADWHCRPFEPVVQHVD